MFALTLPRVVYLAPLLLFTTLAQAMAPELVAFTYGRGDGTEEWGDGYGSTVAVLENGRLEPVRLTIDDPSGNVHGMATFYSSGGLASLFYSAQNSGSISLAEGPSGEETGKLVSRLDPKRTRDRKLTRLRFASVLGSEPAWRFTGEIDHLGKRIVALQLTESFEAINARQLIARQDQLKREAEAQRQRDLANPGDPRRFKFKVTSTQKLDGARIEMGFEASHLDSATFFTIYSQGLHAEYEDVEIYFTASDEFIADLLNSADGSQRVDDEGNLRLFGDMDGFSSVTIVLNKKDGFKRGYLVRDGSEETRWYSPVTCELVLLGA